MVRGKILKKNTLVDLLVICFLLIIYLTPLFCPASGNKDALSVFTFAVNGLIFIVGIYSAKKQSVSMQMIFWLFMFFFMYFAPVIQYRMNMFPWRASITDEEILYANLIVFLFTVFFIVGGYISYRVKIVGIPDLEFTHWLCSGFELKKKFRIIATVTVCLLAAYSLSRTGLYGIVVSRTQAMQVFYSGQNSSVELIVESVFPAFFAYVAAEAAQNMINKKENGVRFWLILICLLICFFPTAIPRYKAATIYGVIFIVLCPWVRKGSKFFWLFTLGFFILFPLLDTFRNVISSDNILGFFEKGFFESYTDGNYDAYRMLVSAIRYVKSYGSTWGYQLLGVVFFFVPRSLWPSKPIGSGATLITKELGRETFSNVSCPFIAEGLINFGVFGVLLFAFCLGFLVIKMDRRYQDGIKDSNNNGVFSPYLFVVFMLFFVMRGDLLSGFAYVCGFVATGYILKLFAKRI